MYPTTILRQKESFWHKVDADFLNLVGTGHILQDAIRIHEQRDPEDEDCDVVQLHRYIFIW